MKKIIELDNINLKYRFLKNMNIKQEILRLFHPKQKITKLKEIEALKNISFNIYSGHTVGIIGGNGAGKSTLLKLIAGVFQPDSGKIIVRAKSISLLTLGTGFQSELSGYENIYLNGLLLGLKKHEIDQKINIIIEFSGIEDSIHNPIKTYSSGMRQRLAFAIAINAIPEVLLIDEILGVGDQAFKNKSNKIIKELINSNKTVILVSHDIGTLEEVCDKILWLHKGELIQYGETKEVIAEYKKFIKEQK
ncbi:MAG: ABC transporter ATP-binding protein [Cetobacterium sp.]